MSDECPVGCVLIVQRSIEEHVGEEHDRRSLMKAWLTQRSALDVATNERDRLRRVLAERTRIERADDGLRVRLLDVARRGLVGDADAFVVAVYRDAARKGLERLARDGHLLRVARKKGRTTSYIYRAKETRGVPSRATSRESTLRLANRGSVSGRIGVVSGVHLAPADSEEFNR